MRRTILHVGADKCGSTSIQAFLTRNSILTCAPGNAKLNYACLGKTGFVDPGEIKRRISKSITGHQCSLAIQQLRLLDDKTRHSIARKVNACPADLIFSCEGWLRAFANRAALDFFLQLLSQSPANRSLEVIAFLRPPATWINSAWWQWGAWEWEGCFEDWLEGAIRATLWHRFLLPLREDSRIAKITVEPVQADVVAQLAGILNIQSANMSMERCNASLPAEVLYLYGRFRDLRPGPHQSRIDYLVLNAIGNGLSSYQSTPWVLKKEHLERIMQATKDSNKRLLELMEAPACQQVLEDARWWQADAFASCVAVDPMDVATSGPLQIDRLAHDLLDELSRAVQILQGHDLAHLYLAASRKARSRDEGTGGGD